MYTSTHTINVKNESKHNRAKVWWLMYVIPALTWGMEAEYCEFGANLSYNGRPCVLQANRQAEMKSWRALGIVKLTEEENIKWPQLMSNTGHCYHGLDMSKSTRKRMKGAGKTFEKMAENLENILKTINLNVQKSSTNLKQKYHHHQWKCFKAKGKELWKATGRKVVSLQGSWDRDSSEQCVSRAVG